MKYIYKLQQAIRMDYSYILVIPINHKCMCANTIQRKAINKR